MSFNALLTGNIEFDEHEEYLEFRFLLLCWIMFIGIIFTALFIAIDLSGLNSLGPKQLLATELNCAATGALFLLLRGHKTRYLPLCSAFIAVHFATYLSALIFVPTDELRAIWFFVGVVVAYALLGVRAGMATTALTLLGILVANPYSVLPFSRNAMTTLLMSLGVTSAIAYVYTERTISFFERMRASKEKLHELADRDPLTSLLNPRAYYELANSMIRLAQRTATPFAVLFVDLDHFKSINDRFGHETGDYVLQHVGSCLRDQMRQSDVIGRIGGEEFVIFLPNTTLEGASRLAEKLRRFVEQLALTPPSGIPLRITASIGIATGRSNDLSVADIQRRADRAMYEAKAQGRNRIVVEGTP